MAAEVSTGLLGLAATYKRSPSVSMLVVKSEGIFYKKATGRILFTCNDGVNINNAVEKTMRSGEGITVICNTKGVNEKGELVAEFNFSWSFKARS